MSSGTSITHGPQPTISIGGVDLTRIEYRGEQVVTFAMVDKVHGRPEGTAKRNFNENEGRFETGTDFVLVKAADLRRLAPEAVGSRGGGDVTLITRRGYLKLVKPMNDDRAWAVQGEMVDRYFAVERLPVAPEPAHTGINAREARLTFKHHLGIAKMLKLEGNQAVLAANRATKAMCGVAPLDAMGITHVTAPQNEPLLNCTDIGKRLGDYSAQDVNRYLVQFGYQVALRDAKDKLYYEVTDLGRDAGGVMQDTGKSHGDGTPVRQLRWASGIVAKLRADIAKPETIHG
ncbi:ORF6N domain-containing protein [Methylobacterium terricola]|nr:ORF6N domain-containing protein [Methylobacterium terricola]